MGTLRSQKITGCIVSVAYLALMVTAFTLNCPCCTKGEHDETHRAAHEYTHDSCEPCTDAHDDFSVVDQQSTVRPCCRCQKLSTRSAYPHIASIQEESILLTQGSMSRPLENSQSLMSKIRPRSGAPPGFIERESQIVRLKTIFLLI